MENCVFHAAHCLFHAAYCLLLSVFAPAILCDGGEATGDSFREGGFDMLCRNVARLCPLLLAMGCVPQGAPLAPSAAAPDAPVAPDIRVITPEQAAQAGLTPVDLDIPFAEEADGTHMLEGWVGAARSRGATRVGDLVVYVVKPHGDDLVECRSVLYPENSVAPEFVGGGYRLVPVTRPVTRYVTRYEYRCHMESKPVTHSETTYSMQYDSFSKSSRSVPQTRMVTRYEMRNECRSEPVSKLETHWEYTLEGRYEPPRVEYLARMRLKETEPACYVAPSADATSRVEGKLYLQDKSTEGKDPRE
jgi:hypothetical protein